MRVIASNFSIIFVLNLKDIRRINHKHRLVYWVYEDVVE